MKPVVFILADAFRFDYIEKHNLSFLNGFIHSDEVKLSKELYPSTGFCEIIEYFTGQESYQHGMFSQITAVDDWSKRETPFTFKLLESLDLKLSGIRKVRFVWSKVLSKILPIFVDKSVVNIKYKVPLSILNRFTPTESLYRYDSYDFGGDKNVFYEMKCKNISYDLDDFVKHNKILGTDKDRFKRLAKKIESHTLSNFTMIYVSAPEYAHFYGVNGAITKQRLQDFDSELERINKLLKENYDDYDLLIVGDHGMLDVHETINVDDIIKKVAVDNNYILGRDYIYFIDSTVCRLWYSSTKIQSAFEKAIESQLSDELELSVEHLNYLSQFKPMYGNSLYMLKAHKIFFPDFFNGIPNKGMHGYLNHYPGQQGCILWRTTCNKNLPDKIKLSEVRNIIWSSVNEQC